MVLGYPPGRGQVQASVLEHYQHKQLTNVQGFKKQSHRINKYIPGINPMNSAKYPEGCPLLCIFLADDVSE